MTTTLEVVELRAKCKKLKEIYHIPYVAIAKESNVSYQTIKNFVSGYRNGMKLDNWLKFSEYVNKMYDKLIKEKK